MLQKEERQKVDIPPIIFLCYQYIFPLSDKRVLGSNGTQIVLIDIDGYELCKYDAIQVPIYNQVDKNAKYNIQQEEDFENQLKLFSSKDYEPDCDIEYIDEYLLVCDNGKYGVIDYDGNILIPIEYNKIEFSKSDDDNILAYVY